MKQGITTKQFIEAERGVRNGLMKTQQGFISKESGLDETGSWFMDMRFGTKANMENWFVALKQEEQKGI